MSFYFKIAPGVRVRASRGGLRTSIGPRAARVHIGGGYRTGVSTGAGPFTLYRNIGGRRRTSGSSHATVAARQRQLAQAAKLGEARQLANAFQHILELHRGEFPPVQPPVAPDPDPLDESAIRTRHEREALSGISIFRRAERRRTKQEAANAAEAEIAAQRIRAQADRDRTQAELDKHWDALCSNEPDVVLVTLAEAFEDNETPAAAVSVTGDQVALVVLVPGMGVVPERIPGHTQAGNLSITKLSKTNRNGFYNLVVCGHLLATVREAFAVAPGIKSIRAAVIRLSERDAYGRRRPECLLAAQFAREAMDGVLWGQADAGRIVNDVSTGLLIHQTGQAQELKPLNLQNEPELRAMLDVIDFEDEE